MFEKTLFHHLFAARLTQLREQKGVSASEMSRAIGKARNYISDIEARSKLPSMKVFAMICDYLGITPAEFFDDKNPDPISLLRLIKYLRMLNPRQLALVMALVLDMLHISFTK